MPQQIKTVNQEYYDALIRHQTYLIRYSGSIRNKITDLLNATEEDLAEKIRSRLQNAEGLTTASFARLEKLNKYIKETRTETWKQVEQVWNEDLTELVKQEPLMAASSLATVSPVILDTVIPETPLLKALVKSHPFEGRVLKQWATSIKDTDIQRIQDTIKIGMVQGESSADIARRVVGSAALKGTDGVTQITRQNAEAITRTAVNSLGNAARNEFFKANKDLFTKELYVATLDNRTTAVCRANDGKMFETDKGPIPPLHFNCRSLRVPVIDGEVLGERPAKPTSERLLLKQFAAQNKLEGITSRDDLPRGTKGAFDEFSRKQIRALTGQVPAQTSYQQWLKTQSSAFQDDVLGKTKAKLFRDGGLELDKFVNRKGDELSLGQLAKKHEDAFKAAGLDPKDF